MKHTPITLWRKQKKGKYSAGIRGTIISVTIIRVAPKIFGNQAPYPVVLVEDAKGNRYIGQLVDYQDADVAAGKLVISVTRRLPVEKDTDVLAYGIKFKPFYE
ncbi:MAG: OB-fold domain-containing protein [Candidatus Levybacteria bacterium]|nr:OB-fold domain-containing protein [Candidatus Levybacteria bacterium]